jgi:hypothetical protein
MKSLILFAIAALPLTSCSKELSAENLPTVPPVHDTVYVTPPVALKDTGVYLVGLPQAFTDSLRDSLKVSSARLVDQTTSAGNLDYLIHSVTPAPPHSVVVMDVISQDVFSNRDTEADYILRMTQYRDALTDAGWDVIVLYPRGQASSGGTDSGFTGAEYLATLHSISAKLYTMGVKPVPASYKSVMAAIRAL